MGDLHLTVASWSDRDDLVVELTVGEGSDEEDWGLVTYDAASGRAVIDIHPRASGGEWHFDLDELCEILAPAKLRILDVAGPVEAAVE